MHLGGCMPCVLSQQGWCSAGTQKLKRYKRRCLQQVEFSIQNKCAAPLGPVPWLWGGTAGSAHALDQSACCVHSPCTLAQGSNSTWLPPLSLCWEQQHCRLLQQPNQLISRPLSTLQQAARPCPPS